MASRAGFPVNSGTPVNPMSSSHPGGMRMPQSSGFRAVPSAASPYPRSVMPPSRSVPMGSLGSLGAPLPGPSYSGTMPVRPGMPQTPLDPVRKRLLQQQQQQQHQQSSGLMGPRRGVKRRKMADKVLPQRIRDLVPESQAYMDLLAFERKLDQTIARKRMEIQEAIKKPITVKFLPRATWRMGGGCRRCTQKRKLRVYISNTCTPGKLEGEESEKVASWELRVEGKLLEDPGKQKRKFSSFFKSLVIELDKELYGPDNHLVEWHRMPTTQETDGFQVKRPGDVNVKCTLLLMLDHQPPQYKLDPRLARLLGVHTQTRASIMQALWLYIKTNKLQDCHEKEFINCNRYFRQVGSRGLVRTVPFPRFCGEEHMHVERRLGQGLFLSAVFQIFACPRMRFSEIPMKLAGLLQHPDPIVINHVISVVRGRSKTRVVHTDGVSVLCPLLMDSVDPNDQKKTACFDIDVEVDDPLKSQMASFLSSTTNQQEIAALEMKIHETIESINQLKTQRDFMLSFSNNPQDFIQDWLKSQSRDLKLMTDTAGNPEEERRSAFFQSSWTQEAVSRYVFAKVQQRRQELEQVLGIRLT
ncbi:hypothetical protein P4O66_011267 [Electrophorus voltai]|uniref:DM2 domain-containing protein n=1 Tax=Electrophorus voltai TaxID=2609070 RepID=A0AAD8Z794_9TELE|nr:hypothetical protein P4O66_011267 [Electrophorus voltai]